MGDEFSCQIFLYPSGTILSSGLSPFLPPIKGVLFNQAEPEESSFAENDYGQWLAQLSQMVREDKSILNKMLCGGLPEHQDDFHPIL